MIYSIDVEKIMDEIRNDIARRDLDDSILEFDLTVTDKRLINQMQFASETALVAPNRKIDGNKLIQTIKRFIRKGTRFYVQPIVEDQNRYNMTILQVAEELLKHIEECETKLQNQDHEIKRLRRELDRISLKSQMDEGKE